MDRSEWVWVPREPTFPMWDSAENAMIEAEIAYENGDTATRNDAFSWPTLRLWQAVVAYRAMLAAAPTPPAEQASGKDVEGLPQPFGYIKPRDDLSGYDVFDEPGPGRAAIWNLHGLQAALSQPPAVDEAIERLRGNPKLWKADLVGDEISVERMTAILTAALAPQQPTGEEG